MKLTKFSKSLFAALAMTAVAGQAFAVTFSGASTGIFDNAMGEPLLATTGQGTNAFTWGANDPALNAPPPPNSLTFLGSSFDDECCGGEAFPLGSITYVNGRTLPNTNATQVDLLITIAFTSPALGDVSLDYLLTLFSTDNTSDPVASADIVTLPATAGAQLFSLGGKDYILNLSFSTGGGSFPVQEDSFATTNLLGHITCVPESGSSLVLLGGGMLLVSGIRRKLKAKQ